MVKPRQRKTPTDKSIDDFAAGADKPAGTLNKKAPRNYKSLTVGLNAYEYMQLKAACESADRGVLDFVRQSLKSAIEKELG
jgi:hypothetical protein